MLGEGKGTEGRRSFFCIGRARGLQKVFFIRGARPQGQCLGTRRVSLSRLTVARMK